MMLVRPTLEYASSSWNPYTDTDINRLEQVQKSAARFVCNNYKLTTSTSGLISALGWDTLEQRRLFNQSVLFYKFHNGLVNFLTRLHALLPHLLGVIAYRINNCSHPY